jgi:hypothetical protein
MAKRTVHVVSEAAQSKRISFGAAKIMEISAVDPSSKSIKFACWLGRGFEKLFDRMEWQVPEVHTTTQGLDGNFKGGSFTLTAKDKLIDAEVEIDFLNMTGFQCKRLELEGKKGKGFRRELRFSATFKEPDGLAKLEAYQNASDNARGTLLVNYLQEPVQADLEDTTQLAIGDEQRTATSKDAD